MGTTQSREGNGRANGKRSLGMGGCAVPFISVPVGLTL